MVSTLTVAIGPTESGAVGVELLVDGRGLVELVTDFEKQRGWSPAGGYGGLIPAHFNFGDLPLYFLGLNNDQWPRPRQAWLLGCECGEVGCWPLEASVVADQEAMTWTAFRQPFRPERDYAGFGPFTFNRANTRLEYERRSKYCRAGKADPDVATPPVREPAASSPSERTTSRSADDAVRLEDALRTAGSRRL